MYISRQSYFLTIAETQNLTKAAQVLHVSQPSLTQYVNRLEQDLGVKLLNRNHTPLQLTEAGKLYLNFIQSSLDLEKRFKNELEQYKAKGNHSLSVGVPTQLIPLIFGTLLHGFIQKTPSVSLSLKDGTSITVMDQILKGQLNLAFFHTDKKHDPRFNRHILQTERLLLVCNRDCALAKGRVGTREKPCLLSEQDLRQLESMIFITFSEKYFIHKITGDYLEKINLPSLPIMELPNMKTALDYILAPESNGISVLSDFIYRDMSLDNLTFMKIKGFSPKWYLTANYLSHEKLSAVEYLFWKDIICKTSFPDV